MKVRCDKCGLEFSKYGIKNHISVKHEGKILRKYEPISPWNKGLTKKNSDVIKKYSEKISKTLTGKPGHKQTEETKKKISHSRIEYLKKNPDKVPYKLNHSSKKSWIEKVFEKCLIENKIDGWIYNYNFDIYRLDFAFPEWKLDVELDGSTHQNEKVKIIDERRNQYLKSQGWKVLRFTGKEIKENVYECLQKLCNELKNDKIIEIPKEFLNNQLEKMKKNELKQITKQEKEKRKKEKENKKISMMLDFLKHNENCYTIIQKLSKHLKVSHSTIRRLSKRNNIYLYSRKGP